MANNHIIKSIDSEHDILDHNEQLNTNTLNDNGTVKSKDLSDCKIEDLTQTFNEFSEKCDTNSRHCDMGTPTLPKRPNGLKVFKLRKCSSLNSELSPISQLVHCLVDTKIDANPNVINQVQDATTNEGESYYLILMLLFN